MSQELPQEVKQNLPKVIQHRASFFGEHYYIGYFPREEHSFSLLCVGHLPLVISKSISCECLRTIGNAYDQID